MLYFNNQDTLTYRKDGGLLRLRDTFQIISYYRKGVVNADYLDLSGNSYRIGSKHLFIQRKSNPRHKRKYLPKDSFDNYEIVKVPWKGNNIDIIDMSNPDSAYIVTVDFVDMIE